MTTIQALLRQAKQNGADRIYGWKESVFAAGDRYILKAVDGAGKTYFCQKLNWRGYLEAVVFWQQLNAAAWRVFEQLEDAS